MTFNKQLIELHPSNTVKSYNKLSTKLDNSLKSMKAFHQSSNPDLLSGNSLSKKKSDVATFANFFNNH